MPRAYIKALCLLVVVGSATLATAQESWPDFPLDGHHIERGPGHYFSWVKLLLLGIAYLVWVKTTNWLSRDANDLKLNGGIWVPANFFPFVVALLVIALSVAFPVGFTVVVLSWIGPLGAYIYHRNASAEEHERILTPSHFRFLAATLGQKMGLKINAEKKAAYEKGAPVNFSANTGANESKNQANMILARQSTSFVPAKNLIADSIDRRATKLMFDVEADQVVVRYHIDGVWHETDPLDRENGGALVDVLKQLADAEPEQRRKRQEGGFQVQYQERRQQAELVSQGTKTGERVIIQFVDKKMSIDSIGDAGMRDGMQQELKKLLAADKGVIVFCSVPGGGLSTTMALAGKLSDRYMRDFVSFQNVNAPEPVADNIDIDRYDPSKESPKQKIVTLFRKDPDVIIVPDLIDKEFAEIVLNQVIEGKKLLMTSVRAKEAVEALLRVLLLKVPAKIFAPLVLGVLNQRLVRKLCLECREEYAPSPELLKKLGIPAGRVEILYRVPQVEEGRPPCKACGGLGFIGRTSIFELLVADDAIRKQLIEDPKLDILRKLARKTGCRTLQEEGIALVARGVTSLEELMRVLKQ